MAAVATAGDRPREERMLEAPWLIAVLTLAACVAVVLACIAVSTFLAFAIERTVSLLRALGAPAAPRRGSRST
jgi:hypothetical protein